MTINYYVAIYREQRNGSTRVMTQVDRSKKAFADDLRGNGYRVVAVYTFEQIEEIINADDMDILNRRDHALAMDIRDNDDLFIDKMEELKAEAQEASKEYDEKEMAK